jgi:lipopolysaccharide/colanic/teichoic acid biosynthesis glycosyltransferase
LSEPGIVKRAFDVTLASLGLILSCPVWILITLAIKIDDGGSVFYRQERVGKGTQLFTSYKFRSMIVDADERFGPLQARSADPRVTRVGALLRATALDELPQLWNILRGDMSFVGPRALMPQEVEVNSMQGVIPLEKIPGYWARHAIQPGLTGIAQIYADRDITRRDKFRYDRVYIQRRSFWLDIKLIALSVWITLRAKWEHRGRKF